MGLPADGGTAEAMIGAINEADKKAPVMAFFAQFILQPSFIGTSCLRDCANKGIAGVQRNDRGAPVS
jgi:hypothetical protein